MVGFGGCREGRAGFGLIQEWFTFCLGWIQGEFRVSSE